MNGSGLGRIGRLLLRSPFPYCRRYATSGTNDGAGQLKLSFVCPHQVFMREMGVEQVNLSTTDGDLGILANHVPAILQLKPGLIEILQSTDKRQLFFASGGFAMVNPDSSMEISAMEVVPLEQLDPKAVADGLAEVSKRTPKDDNERAEAQIHQEIYQAMSNALGKIK